MPPKEPKPEKPPNPPDPKKTKMQSMIPEVMRDARIGMGLLLFGVTIAVVGAAVILTAG